MDNFKRVVLVLCESGRGRGGSPPKEKTLYENLSMHPQNLEQSFAVYQEWDLCICM